MMRPVLIGAAALLMGSVALAGEAAAPPSAQTALETAQVYFESAEYALALEQTDSLDADSLPVERGHALLVLRARCFFEQAQAAPPDAAVPLLNQARQPLRRITQKKRERNERVPFKREARFWLGRIAEFLGMVLLRDGDTESALPQLVLAEEHFRHVLTTVRPGDLDFECRFYLARTQKKLAAAQPERRAELYAEAIRSLALLVRNYPTAEERPRAEYALIELLVEAQRYEDAIDACARFVKQFPEHRLQRTVQFYWAESLYYAGRLQEAIRLYEAGIASRPPAARRDPWVGRMHYGRGWCFARLASTAVHERRRTYLRSAAQAFDKALQDEVFRAGPRYGPARYKYAETVAALGNWKQALALLAPVLDDVQYRLSARLLAGRAARGAGENAEAHHHFLTARYLAARQSNREVCRKALAGLFDIELAWGRPGRALAYARESLEYALVDRDEVAIAAARLRLVRALLGFATLPYGDDTDQEGMALEGELSAVGRLLPLLGHGATDLGLEMGELAAHLNGLRLRLRYAPADSRTVMLRSADTSLGSLILQHRRRVRMDEVLYTRGRVRAELARLAAGRVAPNPAGKKMTVAEADAMRELFEEAEASFVEALDANPRGTFAVPVLYELGRIRLESGRTFRQLAQSLTAAGERQIAEAFRGLAQTQLSEATTPLAQAAERSGHAAVSRRARYRLGLAYEGLEQRRRAERALRRLLDGGGVEADLQKRASQALARVLEEDGRLAEAAEALEDELERSVARPVALDLGGILERLGRRKQARRAYEQILTLPLPGPEEPAARERHAEGVYRTHALGILEAMDDARRHAELLAKSVQELRRMPTYLPQSPWSAEAVVVLARHLVQRGQTGTALAVTRDALTKVKGLTGRLRILSMAGEVLQADGRFEEASQYLAQVEEEAASSPRGRRIQARALILQARGYLARGRAAVARGVAVPLHQKGLATLAKVWATFPDIADMADMARLEAGQHHLTAGEVEKALPILNGMAEKARAVGLLRAASGEVELTEVLPDPHVSPPLPDVPPERTP